MNSKLLLFLFLTSLMSCKNDPDLLAIGYSNNTVPLSIAYPISNITIDGKIDDWDKALPKYQISNLLENKIANSDDLSAVFKIGFSERESSIYIAVIVTDNYNQIDNNSKVLSDNQDQCLIYLDKTHSAKGSGVNVYSFNELHKDIDDASTSWDPAVRNANWDTIEVASKRNGNKTIYEARIRFDERLSANKMIGLDFMIYDVDNSNQENDLTRISWRDSDGKTNIPFKLGNILLADKAIEMGTIQGLFDMENGFTGPSHQ